MLLIVDDDLDIRESLSDYFAANGFKVMLAENAEGHVPHWPLTILKQLFLMS